MTLDAWQEGTSRLLLVPMEFLEDGVSVTPRPEMTLPPVISPADDARTASPIVASSSPVRRERIMGGL
jgi:hypothetical protein